MKPAKIQEGAHISVVVPKTPFSEEVKHCLCALDVEQLMEWWPGKPHTPHRDPKKVRAIQRSLDWKRVAQIAAYLLQKEIPDCGEKLDEIFSPIYEPRRHDIGREWPPPIRGTVKFNRSTFPFFTNVLIHVNGATLTPKRGETRTATIDLDPSNPEFLLQVIDGQHRINGAYFALMLLKETTPDATYEVPAEVFLDLDPHGSPPQRQAQIFIDVNLHQKKVDRSLVADLFPTTRGDRPLDRKDRAQDIGRKLMLEVGPLVGMIQIPGIKYGVKDVVTLATLNTAIERVLEPMERVGIRGLEAQTAFLAQLLECWLEASGRAEEPGSVQLDPGNVVYQGRILVSILDLTEGVIGQLFSAKITALVSDAARAQTTKWLKKAVEHAGMSTQGKFMDKEAFKRKGYLGSGGIGRFRSMLWAGAFSKKALGEISEEEAAAAADKARVKTRLAMIDQDLFGFPLDDED